MRFTTPEVNSIFNLHNSEGIKPLTKLRVEFQSPKGL